MIDPVSAICWYVTFLFCTVLHEAAHAWAAKLGGDLTAYYGGQVSIDPVPHIRREPIGMVVLPVISLLLSGWPFGYASAPYDPYWAERYPKRAAWMALAGPAANLLTAVVAGVLIRIGYSCGVFEVPASISITIVAIGAHEGIWSVLALFLSMLFSLGLILAVFNLLPIPPLDGSGALPLFLSNEITLKYRQMMNQPGFVWIGLIIAWNIFGPIFRPVFHVAIDLLYPWL
ncbi:MAG: site-2 protease family protein [Kiritimatiellae bacterium]|nr:site-2 protease family protein [Kiritimatiellia bacterium]MDD5521131.1 site-2 protease family protein [Kiritimatiellia bacterium]